MEHRERLGFHYFPDDNHYTQHDLEQWLPALMRLSASWLVLRGATNRAIPEDFIRGLVESGIRPIIHIASDMAQVNVTELAPLIASYGNWGIRELIVFDRPNMRYRWPSIGWSRPGLVERFIDRLMPVLQLERSAGMHPIFPPLEPGGDYWDTAFLETALRSMLRRGDTNLVHDLRIATYAWTYEHALDWGSGGPSHWPESYPYGGAELAQNQQGFRTFDWYGELSQSVVGRTLPMIVIAGGSSGPHELVPEVVTGSARALLGSRIPEAVLAFNYHLLAADPGTAEHAAAWFASPDEPKPIVAALERMLNAVTQTPKTSVTKKPLRHYVLMPEGGLPEPAWGSVRELATDGVFGYSAEEAQHASLVTIVGDESAIPPSVERKLAKHGCQVRRIAPQHPIWQRMRRDNGNGDSGTRTD